MDWCKRKQRGALMFMTDLYQLMLGVEEYTALQITYRIGRLAHRSGDVKWAGDLYNEVSELARRKNYPVEQAKALMQLGFLAQLEGNKPVAITNLKEAVNVGHVAGEAAWRTIASSCNSLGRLLMNQGEYPLAEQYLQEGLQAAKQSNNDSIIPAIVGILAYLYRNQNDLEKGYILYREETHNLSGVPLAFLLIGIIPRLIEINSLDEAWDRIQEARDILREENNIGALAYTWCLQGDWYWKKNELERAEKSFQEEERLRHLAVEENEQEMHYLIQAMWTQFHFFQKTNQLDKARKCLARCKAIKNIPVWLKPPTMGHEAVLLLALGDYREATQRCRKAMKIYQEQDSMGGCAWIKRIQGNIEAAQGNFRDAIKSYETGLELRSRQGATGRTATDLEYLAEFYLHQMHDVEQARKYLASAQIEFQKVDAIKASAIQEKLRTLQA